MSKVSQLEQLYAAWQGQTHDDINPLAQAGSERVYYRLSNKTNGSVLGVCNPDIAENHTYIAMSRRLRAQGVSVPDILAVSEDESVYLVEDLGDTSLLNAVIQCRRSGEDFPRELYKKALKELVKLQIAGGKDMDSLFLRGSTFDQEAMMRDLHYCYYYFLRVHRIPHDTEAIEADFKRLSQWLNSADLRLFMMRDCQARNIMIKDGEPYFIDFQDGKYGAPHYDCASLLYQAKADIDTDTREELADYYFECLAEAFPELTHESFKNYYYGFALLRVLQTLGSYGYRGLFERRSHFLESIPFALKTIRAFVDKVSLPIALPELMHVLDLLATEERIAQYSLPKAKPDAALTVTIKSFSYKKGIPEDHSGNGGGFVFDCRGMENPGRYEAYKHLSGLDTEVQAFLNEKTEMPKFLKQVYAISEISIKDYLNRDFQSLCIFFGCTGGQHRSVYAAEQTAKHISSLFGCNVVLEHSNQANWRR